MTRHLPLSGAVLVALLLLAGGAAAHEGHDHADQTKSVVQVGASPRLEAASGPFELVAVLQKGGWSSISTALKPTLRSLERRSRLKPRLGRSPRMRKTAPIVSQHLGLRRVPTI